MPGAGASVSKGRKKLAEVRFGNGARFRAYFVKDPPPMAAHAYDHLYISIKSAKGRGGEEGWYMNGYDVTQLIWLLAAALDHCQKKRIPMLPEK